MADNDLNKYTPDPESGMEETRVVPAVTEMDGGETRNVPAYRRRSERYEAGADRRQDSESRVRIEKPESSASAGDTVFQNGGGPAGEPSDESRRNLGQTYPRAARVRTGTGGDRAGGYRVGNGDRSAYMADRLDRERKEPTRNTVNYLDINAPVKKRKAVPVVLVILLILAAVYLVATKVFGIDPAALLNKPQPETERITGFAVMNNTNVTAPVDTVFTVTADKTVTEMRVLDDEGYPFETAVNTLTNTENCIWTLKLELLDGYEGTAVVQYRIGEGEWTDASEPVELTIAAPPAELTTPVPEETATPAPGEASQGQEMPAAETATPEPTEEPTATPEPTEEPTATPEPTEEPTATPDPTATPALQAKADPSADPALLSDVKVYDGTKSMDTYIRTPKDTVAMPVVGNYSKQNLGILTFRNDAFRQNASVGTVPTPAEMEVVWTAPTGSIRGADSTYYGIGWTGQPLVVKWSKEIREMSNIKEEKKATSGLKEVIAAGLDGNIYFLDLADGQETRNPIRVGYPMRGTPSLHPGGVPFMSVGQYARKMKSGTGKIGLRSYNLYNQKEFTLIDGLDGKMKRGNVNVGSFETSALIDRTSDTMVTAGTNGLLYVTKLNGDFDYQQGRYSVKPVSIVMSAKAGSEKKENTSVEASVAMYDGYVFYGDMGGILRCVDVNTMTVVWATETGDSIESTVALDLNGDSAIDLYTANELNLRKKGDVQVRCVNALSGKVKWTADFGVAKDTKKKTVSGFRASPAIGQNNLSGLVFYTVTGLSSEGCQQLDLPSCKAATVALNKENGKVVWARELSSYSYSSPVAVYDENGDGWIVQAAGDGTILLLDGLTGREVTSLKVDGTIEASPAVYNSMLVIPTTWSKGSNLYGIEIR